MEQESNKSKLETLIGFCHNFLAARDFAACRRCALLALESDPSSPELAKILAIADVLLAAESRLPNNRHDYYSILQLTGPGSVTRPSVLTQFKKFVTLINPSKNKFPFSQEAFNLLCDAWSVLSKPEKKKNYDFEILNDGANVNRPRFSTKLETGSDGDPNRNVKSEGKQKEEALVHGKQKEEALNNREQKEGTFWTVCPYCYVLFEYEKGYRECCLKCQNCRRAFQAVETGPLPPGLVVEGRDEYLCAIGFFKFGYPWGGFLFPKEEKGGSPVCGMGKVVEISDDSEVEDGDNDDEVRMSDENGEMGTKSEGSKEETPKGEDEVIEKNVTVGVMQRRLNGKRVKSVARNTKKGMRRGMKKIKIPKSCGDDNDDDEGDLEFFEADDDIYISLKDGL